MATNAFLSLKVGSSYVGVRYGPPPPDTDGLIPIARWDTVPYQRINAGETLNVGVVAFSKEGIWGVGFSIDGGEEHYVISMTENLQTGVWEYWYPISADDFTSDGVITIAATVYGNDGGRRTASTDGGDVGLDDLTLVVNPNDTLPTPLAYVDATFGVNATGQVSEDPIVASAHPYLSIRYAASAIQAWRLANGHGNNGDGGIIKLNAGTHTSTTGTGATCVNECLEVTTDDNVENVILNAAYILNSITKLKIQGVTLSVPSSYGFLINTVDQIAWIEDCEIIGAGQWTAGSNAYSSNPYIYLTNSHVINVINVGLGGAHRLSRNVRIEHVGDDPYQNAPFLVNIEASDLNRGITGAHIDCYQLQWASGTGGKTGGPTGNVIIYGYRATEAVSGSIFVADYPPDPFVLQGAAIINCYLNIGGLALMAHMWGCPTNHLLWWNNSIIDSDEKTFLFNKLCINSSMIGNIFTEMAITDASYFNVSYIKSNHFVTGTSYGDDASSGSANLSSYGRPQSGSVLIDRVNTTTVPIDASNTVRIIPSDVGAYEHF